jgi:hypothetical protein
LLASIQKTKQVIVVLDQHDASTYERYIKSWLYETGLIDLVRIQFITPDIAAINTNTMSALYEQAGFGVEGIVEQILS